MATNLVNNARRPQGYGRKRRGRQQRREQAKKTKRPPKAIPSRRRYLKEHRQPVDIQAFRQGFIECWREAKQTALLGSWEAVLEGAGWAKPGDWRLLQSQFIAGSMDLAVAGGVLGRLLKNGGIKLLLLWKFHQSGMGDRWRAGYSPVSGASGGSLADRLKSRQQRYWNGDEDNPYAWEGYA